MKQLLYTLLCIFLASVAFSQNENVLYIVDTVPVFEEPEEGAGFLSEEEIDKIDVVKNKELIKEAGFGEFDGLIYVYTKEYANRPDSLKAIPTTKLMRKRNGTWFLDGANEPYTGQFIDYYFNGKKEGEGFLSNGKLKGKRLNYHVNGNVSDEYEYDNGIANGLSKRYYPDGTLMQKGVMKNGIEVGSWELYHPNGQLQQRTEFIDGKMDGESISYYSTGEVKGKILYAKGVYQKNKATDKIYEIFNQGQALSKAGNFKSAIKKYTKCIELRENWAEGYFARGTAKLNDFQFDEAIEDFNKAIEIEPYYDYAYANRAFSLIRKYEFSGSRELANTSGVKILATKKVEIPESDKSKICEDLAKAIELGDDNWMVLDAAEKHCE